MANTNIEIDYLFPQYLFENNPEFLENLAWDFLSNLSLIRSLT